MAGMYPDNQTISMAGKPVVWPGVDADGKFTNGDFNNPLVPPSFIPADTINLVLDNLQNLISSLGADADNTSITQLANLFTSAAVAKKGIARDANGRAQVAVPVAPDDIARLAEINAHAASGSTHPAATTRATGMMSAQDKERLDNNYIVASNFSRVNEHVNGYIKYSNGFMIQWMSGTSHTDRAAALTPPLSFQSWSIPFGVHNNSSFAEIEKYYSLIYKENLNLYHVAVASPSSEHALLAGSVQCIVIGV